MMFHCDLVCVHEHKRAVPKLDSGCAEDAKDRVGEWVLRRCYTRRADSTAIYAVAANENRSRPALQSSWTHYPVLFAFLNPAPPPRLPSPTAAVAQEICIRPIHPHIPTDGGDASVDAEADSYVLSIIVLLLRP